VAAVPQVLGWDGEGATCRWRARQPQLTTACQAFRGVLGANVLICKPADPGAKGIIDRCRTTWNAHARQPVLTACFNRQLNGWLELVNRRRKRSLGCAHANRIAADKAGGSRWCGRRGNRGGAAPSC